MTEWRLQDTDYPSTFEYHRDRERVPHLEQSWHSTRLYVSAKFVRSVSPRSVVDLGCGDGGFLSLFKDSPIEAWGYDFQPSNAAGWAERGVTAELRDIFNFYPDDLRWGECAVATEVLEHLADPHHTVKWIAKNARYLVASSPVNERPGEGVCDSHLWSWDFDGYRDLLNPHFQVINHRVVDWNQVILGRSRYV